MHDMPGTTRDTVDTVVETPDGPIRFVDTAGMRRKSKIDDGPEYYSLVRALRSVDDADIALLVIDATEGVTSQDQRLAERIDAAGCPVVVLLNKWDLLPDAEARAAVTDQLALRLHFIGDAPVLKVSALTGKGVHKLLPVLADAIERYHRRVPTRDVNRVIAEAQQAQPAPGGARVLYALQGATDPPTFTLFANRELPPQYLRYLERKLREAFDLGAVPDQAPSTPTFGVAGPWTISSTHHEGAGRQPPPRGRQAGPPAQALRPRPHRPARRQGLLRRGRPARQRHRHRSARRRRRHRRGPGRRPRRSASWPTTPP